jgi:acylphosphatase
MDVVTKHLIVRGRVQGVCFRAWTIRRAGEIGLTGWVRNCANGDVEAVVQGDDSAIGRFLALVRKGPPAARVDSVEVRDEAAPVFARFEQKATI